MCASPRQVQTFFQTAVHHGRSEGRGNIFGNRAVKHFHAPGGNGIRVDSHLYSGYKVPSNYDSLIGKLITWGSTRDEAMARMRNALDEIVVDGIKTNIPLHRELMVDAKFMAGGTNIHYLEEWLSQHKR